MYTCVTISKLNGLVTHHSQRYCQVVLSAYRVESDKDKDTPPCCIEIMGCYTDLFS